MFGEHLSGDVLSARAEATPERTALVDIDTDRHWTVRELDRAATQAARTLASTGDTDAGSARVGLLLSTRPAFVVTLYGALRAGLTVVPLNVRLSPPELQSRIDRVDPRVTVCERATEERLLEALDDSETEASVRSVDEPLTDHLDGVVPDSTLDADHLGEGPPGPDETALILFTSGTTGAPKGVRLTPRNLLMSAVASAFRLGVTPEDRWLCCLPMYHMGGLAPAVRTLLYGTELVIQRAFDATATAEVLDDRTISGVSLVPTQLRRLLDATDESLAGPALRTVLLGGAPASASLLERAATADVPVYPTYGLTETASQVATARPSTAREHPGTVGQPLLGTQVRIVSHEGDTVQALEPGERGEVVVSGPTVTPGYLDADQTAEAFGTYGLHTGDLGVRDEDGRLWIEARLDDVIVTGGELVAPAEVTAQLRSVAGVAEAAVVGLPDEEWGERVAALIVPDEQAPGERQLREGITARCRDHLADYKRPKTLAFAEALPRTQSGTVDREATKATLRDRRSRRDTD